MTASAIISRYNHMKGNAVASVTLRSFHSDVQNHLDNNSHGPLAAYVIKIRQRIAYALKKLAAAGANGAERIEWPLITIETAPVIEKKKEAPKKKTKRVLVLDGADSEAMNAIKLILEGLECNPAEAEGLNGLEFTQDGQKKVYDMVTKLILDTMNKEGLFWRMPWKVGGGGLASRGVRATNFATGTGYKGVNYTILNLIAALNGHHSPYYLTINQIRNLKGSVRKGASAWPVIFYTMLYFLDDVKISEEKYNTLSKAEKARAVVYPIIQYYHVFNGDDIKGIDFPTDVPERSGEPIEAAKKIMEGMPNPPDIQHSKKPSAYYSPSSDIIHMPNIGLFNSNEEYHGTLFHEAVHSTGHKSRLDRKFDKEPKTETGEKASYAFEELIAELGASYLCSEAGILYFTLNNSAAYISGWKKKLIEAMKKDNKFILKATAKAQKASDYILGVGNAPKSKRESKKSRPPVERTERSKAAAEHSLNDLGLKGFTTADQIPTVAENTFTLPGEIGKLLGNLQAYKLEIIVSGETSSSKSELLKQIANAFVSAGYPTAYIDWEQGGMQSKDTQEGVKRNIDPENRSKIHVGEVPRTLEAVKALAKKFKVIVLDSGTKLNLKTNEWVDQLREDHPDTIWIIAMQQNEKGGTRGGSAAEFDSPIVIKTNRPDKSDPLQNFAVVEKNRNNPTNVKYNIAQKKIIESPKEEKL